MTARKVKPFITERGQLVLPWITWLNANAYMVVFFGRSLRVFDTYQEAKAYAQRLKLRPAWLCRKLGRTQGVA